MRLLGPVDQRSVRFEGFGDRRHQPLGGNECVEAPLDGGFDERPQSCEARRRGFAELIEPPPFGEIGRPAELHRSLRSWVQNTSGECRGFWLRAGLWGCG